MPVFALGKWDFGHWDWDLSQKKKPKWEWDWCFVSISVGSGHWFVGFGNGIGNPPSGHSVLTSVSVFGSDLLLSCICKLSQVVYVNVDVLYKVSCLCQIAHVYRDRLSTWLKTVSSS